MDASTEGLLGSGVALPFKFDEFLYSPRIEDIKLLAVSKSSDESSFLTRVLKHAW